MISSQILQNSLDDLNNITKIDLCLLDGDGRTIASTFSDFQIDLESALLFIESAADSQVMQGYYFFKIMDEDVLEYVLIAQGQKEDVYMIGKIAVNQIQQLLVAYKERFDKNNFIQNLLLDNMLVVDIYNRAKKLHIEADVRRVVFLIETKNEKDSMALETIRNLFSNKSRDFITAVEEKSIILVKQLEATQGEEEIIGVANMILDMVNSEAMSSIRIAYGTIVNEIKMVSKSYKEAKMALDIGKIFYSNKTIVSYNMLGIGRLIYQLPLPLCEMFMNEIFKEQMPDTFDEETINTINKFFENNLNVSETSRQLFVHRNTLVYRLEKIQRSTGLDIRVFDDAMTFKIALMVVNYMKYMKQQDF